MTTLVFSDWLFERSNESSSGTLKTVRQFRAFPCERFWLGDGKSFTLLSFGIGKFDRQNRWWRIVSRPLDNICLECNVCLPRNSKEITYHDPLLRFQILLPLGSELVLFDSGDSIISV